MGNKIGTTASISKYIRLQFLLAVHRHTHFIHKIIFSRIAYAPLIIIIVPWMNSAILVPQSQHMNGMSNHNLNDNSTLTSMRGWVTTRALIVFVRLWIDLWIDLHVHAVTSNCSNELRRRNVVLRHTPQYPFGWIVFRLMHNWIAFDFKQFATGQDKKKIQIFSEI